LKQCIALHKNSGRAAAKKLEGLEPLSPIASAATATVIEFLRATANML